MESLLFSPLFSTFTLHPSPPSPRRPKPLLLHLTSSLRLPPLSAVKKSPRGFGPSPPPKKKSKRQQQQQQREEEEEEDYDDQNSDYDRDVTIPEVVTNRMMRRMGLSVGVPLAVGLLFFPFFYYLKVGLKIDVPNWVPFLVSFVFFGLALLGVSYGIVSASWDPTREGSLLGWNEARRNWPVFWESLWGGNDRRR